MIRGRLAGWHRPRDRPVPTVPGTSIRRDEPCSQDPSSRSRELAADSWLAQLDDNIKTRIRNTVGERAYEIVTRVYGRDGVMGALEPRWPTISEINPCHLGIGLCTARCERLVAIGGHEAFILWDVISESQELSRTDRGAKARLRAISWRKSTAGSRSSTTTSRRSTTFRPCRPATAFDFPSRLRQRWWARTAD
jgi:hypothetical protein